MEILKYGNFCSQAHITKQTQITVQWLYSFDSHLIKKKCNYQTKRVDQLSKKKKNRIELVNLSFFCCSSDFLSFLRWAFLWSFCYFRKDFCQPEGAIGQNSLFLNSSVSFLWGSFKLWKRFQSSCTVVPRLVKFSYLHFPGGVIRIKIRMMLQGSK